MRLYEFLVLDRAAVSAVEVGVGSAVAVLFILAGCVGGIIGAVLLFVYRPWSNNLKVPAARTQSTSSGSVIVAFSRLF